MILGDILDDFDFDPSVPTESECRPTYERDLFGREHREKEGPIGWGAAQGRCPLHTAKEFLEMF